MSTAEAIHLGSLVAAHGYIFPISDHVLTLKDDGTLYRFQVRKAPLKFAFSHVKTTVSHVNSLYFHM